MNTTVETPDEQEKPSIDNFIVFLTIQEALEKLGLVYDGGSDSILGGIQNEFHHPVSDYKVIIEIRN